ncbi:hypothetical protein P3342_011535 [Pyrenophora teres f. teres]|nr:hypothetical protein P3342_011535 [Pyrenophora teres f. teres]
MIYMDWRLRMPIVPPDSKTPRGGTKLGSHTDTPHDHEECLSQHAIEVKTTATYSIGLFRLYISLIDIVRHTAATSQGPSRGYAVRSFSGILRRCDNVISCTSFTSHEIYQRATT